MSAHTPEDLMEWRQRANFLPREAAAYIGISAMQYWRMEAGQAEIEKRVQRIIIQWYAIRALQISLNTTVEAAAAMKKELEAAKVAAMFRE